MKGNTLRKSAIYTVLVVFAAIFMIPIFLIASMSLFSEADMLEIPRRILPSVLSFSNYKEVFKVIGVYIDDYGVERGYLLTRYLLNSLLVVVLYVTGCVLSASMCAYSFTKIKFRGREAMFWVVLATMMIPSTVTIIPLYSIYYSLHWIDTLFPLWAPIWFGGGAVNIFLLRQFMHGFPNEILESASIDGAGHIRKWLCFVMPNIVPSLLYVALTSALAVWNDFQTPLLYIYKKELWTIARGVTAMVKTNGVAQGYKTTRHLMFTACMIMSIFPLALFIAGQRYFIESVSITGIKG